MSIYEIPESVIDLFEQGENSYRIIDYDEGMEMDNNESMEYFLEQIEATEENMVLEDGTMVILKHKDFEETYIIESGGLGDFFSHGFDVSLNNE